MAKSTCNPNVELPKGMLRFKVLEATIRDSLGQFCTEGDLAVLSKKDAQVYLDRNHIRVELPDFEDADEPSEPEADNPSEEVGEDETERSETPSASSASGRQRGRRSSSDS